MKLVVKDFGAIKKRSEIDLDKRFYVFVGYNNSGKTYMSQLMWTFYRYLANFPNYLAKIEGLNPFFEVNKQSIVLNISKELIDIILKQYRTFLKQKFAFLPPSLENLFITFSEKDYERIIQSNTSLYLYRKRYEKQSSEKYYAIKQNVNQTTINVSKLKYIDFETDDIYSFFNENNIIDLEKEDLYDIKGNAVEVLVSLIFKFSGSNTYIPSYRTFLPSYYKYIYSVAKEENELISRKFNVENPDLEAIKELSSRPYSEAVDEILEKMQNLDKAKPTEYYSDFIKDLQEIMQGDISFRQSEGIAPIRFGFQTESGVSLDMHNASSSVNQLTLLYLYFKYWAGEKNNFLIIDEPEENLHPANQIKLMNLLVKFANMNNNRVLITTHSPLVAEVVNNHAHISLLKERGENIAEIIKEHDLEITESNKLKHDDYAVYFFDGEQIKNYPMNEYGAFFKDFKAAEEKVKNTADVLKNYIYESSKETTK